MPVPQPLQSRLIGALFVERGLVSESQVRVALEIQRETGLQLGQILVDRFGVSRKELASVVAQQWAKLGGSAGPEDNASWRRLGEIFVERGFVTQDELDGALERQRQTGERLGEALVAQGVISKFELAGALAEQMASLGDPDAHDDAAAEPPEATVHHLPTAADSADVLYGAALEVVEEPATVDEPGETTAPIELVLAAAAEPIEAPADEVEPTVPVELVAESVEEPLEAIEAQDEDTDVTVPLELVAEAAAEETIELIEAPAGEVEPTVPAELVAEAAAQDAIEAPADEFEPSVPVELVAEAAAEEAIEAPLEPEAAPVVEETLADPFPEPTELLVFHGPTEVDANGDGQAADVMAAIACLAMAPTTTGYRLVGLDTVPTAGETVDIPDVGEYLVLRVGGTPLPGDPRTCAFLEERVTPALVESLSV
jgi:hypothetical protein